MASSLYEQTREARIKDNMERMQQLGLKDLSLKLTPGRGGSRRSYNKRQTTPVSLPPTRRSGRLQNVIPVSYTELRMSRKDEDDCIRVLEGSKPEVYTEEHEKLLGNTEKAWTFFVDGYGKDGKRIYDPVNGKTCHQCRQKTLGHRTSCSQCNMVQGQFCGDCLYMRYGEHVLEANENPDWTCPVCRGICNCSLCRQAKGWPATGSLYRRISSLGFKSVAHYLVETKRAKTDTDSDSDVDQNCAKRSLIFSSTEKDGKSQTSPNHENQISAKRSLPFSNIDNNNTSEACRELPKKGGTFAIGRSSESCNGERVRQKHKPLNGRRRNSTVNEPGNDIIIENEHKEATLKKNCESESESTMVDDIKTENDVDNIKKESFSSEEKHEEVKSRGEIESTVVDDIKSEVEKEHSENVSSSQEEKHVGGDITPKRKRKTAQKPPLCSDSVAGRLRQRRALMMAART